MKKIITSCISILIIGVMFLSSCASNSTDPADTSTNIDNGENFDGIWLVDSGTPAFDIVYSENAVLGKSPELAKKLADHLNEICGVDFSVYGNASQAKNDSLIVLGDPSDSAVLTQMNSLGNDGYKISKEENDIVIVAFDNIAMEKAVDILCENVTQSVQKFSNGTRVGFSFAENGDAGTSGKEIRIGENRIDFYTIVYPANNSVGKQAAESLRKVISETVGTELKVTDDSAPAVALEILVGLTNREESTTHSNLMGKKWKVMLGYEYHIVNNKVSVLGGDTENLCTRIACENFVEKLINESDFVLNNTDTAKTSLKMKYDKYAKRPDDADVRIMTANVLSEEWGGTDPVPRADTFYENLMYYRPDVVGVQELSLKWSNALKKIFENSDYELIHDKFPGTKTNYSAIIYNTATTELIDSGVRQMSIGNPIGGRNMAWGLFKDKATEKMYIVFNTHPDWINTSAPDTTGVNSHYSREKEINEIIAYYKEITTKYKDLDVFLTADWNTEKEEHPFNILLEGIPVAFSQDLTSQSSWSAKEIDYILATKDTKVLTSYVYYLNSQAVGISDHPFGYVDAKLK